MRHSGTSAFLATLIAMVQAPAKAQESRTPPWLPRILGAQVTVIGQSLPAFASPYASGNSLVAAGDQAVSHTYGLYFGSRVLRGLGAYLDFEMAKG